MAGERNRGRELRGSIVGWREGEVCRGMEKKLGCLFISLSGVTSVELSKPLISSE